MGKKSHPSRKSTGIIAIILSESNIYVSYPQPLGREFFGG